MLEAKFVRENPDAVRAALESRGRVVGPRGVPRSRRVAPCPHLQDRVTPGAAQRGLQAGRADHARGAHRGRRVAEGRSPLHQRGARRAAEGARRDRRAGDRDADDGPEHPRRLGAVRCRRDSERRDEALGHAAHVRLRAEGALGPRARTRHHRFRASGQAREVAVRASRRDGSTPRAGAHQLHARYAPRGRLQGVVAARARERRDAHRHGAASQVRGRSLQDAGRDHAALPHPHRRGHAHQHPPRRGARGRRPARCTTPRTRRASARRPARQGATHAA